MSIKLLIPKRRNEEELFYAKGLTRKLDHILHHWRQTGRCMQIVQRERFSGIRDKLAGESEKVEI